MRAYRYFLLVLVLLCQLNPVEAWWCDSWLVRLISRIICWITFRWLCFCRNNDVLTRLVETKLIASDGSVAGDDWFGSSVAIDGDTLVIGNSYDDDNGVNSGSAYVFVHSGTTWTEQAKLTASDGAAWDKFGVSVAISGDTLLVGAWGDDDNGRESGSAYVFVHSGTTWTEQAKLTASDGAASDEFGRSVAIDGDTLVIGADQRFNFPGSAYVFVHSGTTWTEQAKLIAGDGADDNLEKSQTTTCSGCRRLDTNEVSVAISGDTLVIGAQYDDDNGPGSAYVFVRSGTTWTEQAKLTASDGAAGDEFGRSVAIDGDTLVVGAYEDDAMFYDDNGISSGSAYVFVRSGTTWTQQVKLTASDGDAQHWFGSKVAIDGDTLVISVDYDYDNGSYSGSVYVFVHSGTTWTEQAKLTASAVYQGINIEIDIDQNRIAVGGLGDGTCVYMFEEVVVSPSLPSTAPSPMPSNALPPMPIQMPLPSGKPTTWHPSPIPEVLATTQPSPSTKVCSDSLGFIGFGGLFLATSLERGKVLVEWDAAQAIPFNASVADSFGCQNITYVAIFDPTNPDGFDSSGNRSIEERINDNSTVAFTTVETSIDAVLVPGTSYSLLVVAVGDGTLYSQNREEVAISVSSTSPVIDPSINWVGSLDINELSKVGVFYDTESTMMTITDVIPPTMPFALDAISVGDAFALLDSASVRYFQIAEVSSKSPSSSSFFVLEKEINELFQDVDVSIVIDLYINEQGQPNQARNSLQKDRAAEMGAFRATPHVLEKDDIHRNSTLHSIPVKGQHQEDRSVLREGIRRTFIFEPKYTIYKDPSNPINVVEVSAFYEMKLFAGLRITSSAIEATLQQDDGWGAKLTAQLDLANLAGFKSIKPDPLALNLLEPRLLFKYVGAIGWIPIYFELYGLFQLRATLELSLKGNFELEWIGSKTSKMSKVVYDRVTKNITDVISPPEKVTKPGFQPRLQAEAEASFGIGLAVVIRSLLFNSVGLDITIYPSWIHAAAVIESAENSELLCVYPYFFTQFEAQMVPQLTVTAYFWNWKEDKPKDPFFSGTFSVEKPLVLLKLPQLLPSEEDDYSYETCPGGEYSHLAIILKNLRPPTWYEDSIIGYENMVEGPHLWIQIGDWDRFELDESSKMAIEQPNFGLSRTASSDEVTKQYLFLEAEKAYEYWLVTRYKGNELIPFVLKFQITGYEVIVNEPEWGFRCCDDYDCLIKFSPEERRESCGILPQEGTLDGYVGDCMPACQIWGCPNDDNIMESCFDPNHDTTRCCSCVCEADTRGCASNGYLHLVYNPITLEVESPICLLQDPSTNECIAESGPVWN